MSLALEENHILGCAAAIFSGTPSDEDWQRYVDWFQEIDKDLAGREAILVVCCDDAALPSARWRREIAEASRVLKSEALFVLISSSMAIRAAVTAINWLRPPPFDFYVSNSEADALQWITARRPHQASAIATVLRRARGIAA